MRNARTKLCLVSFEVGFSGSYEGGVFYYTKFAIAWSTEQFTHLAGGMVVVYGKPLSAVDFLRQPATNRTSTLLFTTHELIVVEADAKSALEPTVPRWSRVLAIVSCMPYFTTCFTTTLMPVGVVLCPVEFL
jgi:hypothetical protein